MDKSSDSPLKTAPKEKGEDQYTYDFGEGGIHAVKHIVFYRRFLLVMRSSHHHEGF